MNDDMSIRSNLRRKLAKLAFAVVAVTTLGGTVLAGPASAHHYSGHVYASRTSSVGGAWGSTFYMSTSANLYKYEGRVTSTTAVWTDGWVGFTGCVSVDFRNA